jgi:hypothetical protein
MGYIRRVTWIIPMSTRGFTILLCIRPLERKILSTVMAYESQVRIYCSQNVCLFLQDIRKRLQALSLFPHHIISTANLAM